jgi:ADP-ribosylglycohydrolase
MTIPTDYIERVYAGVLGKIIGVYLGRPFEGWPYERIMDELGEVWYYVNDHISHHPPLIVTDDDISGTFTFLRALEDYGFSPDLTPAQIGQTWLNYLIERKTILWWGGIGNSTEHTAYLRLKNGILAPLSGSIEMNGPIVAEQIGAQIFIDGWGLINPADPVRAADFARRAASVSHDGAAIHGAQVVAALEAQAFVERDVNKLLDVGLSVIPADSLIYRLIGDIRNWHAQDGDWRKTRERIADIYGYKNYIGGCHMVPNHALIILSLLYGEGDFQKSLMIGNTCGWDTDCNSANIGCLLGVMNGLEGIDASMKRGADWRGPVADRLYLPTADGGRCVSDAVRETYFIVNAGRALQGLAPVLPKGGARFHFEAPGSVQGFVSEVETSQVSKTCDVLNVLGHSQLGTRSLALKLASGMGRVATATFIPPADMAMPGYQLIASPTLYPGQVVTARLEADAGDTGILPVSLFLTRYTVGNIPEFVPGPRVELAPGAAAELSWKIEGEGSQPICQIGLELGAPGTVYLDCLTWSGSPDVVFHTPHGASPWHGDQNWRKPWVQAVDQWEGWGGEGLRIIQNEGRGLLITGCREWQDYTVSAAVRPTLMANGGLAARVQGLKRFYALELVKGGKARLLKALDGDTVLAEAPFAWEMWQPYEMTLEVKGSHLRGWVSGQLLFDVEDTVRPLASGGVALVVEEGHLMTPAVSVQPVD